MSNFFVPASVCPIRSSSDEIDKLTRSMSPAMALMFSSFSSMPLLWAEMTLTFGTFRSFCSNSIMYG